MCFCRHIFLYQTASTPLLSLMLYVLAFLTYFSSWFVSQLPIPLILVRIVSIPLIASRIIWSLSSPSPIGYSLLRRYSDLSNLLCSNRTRTLQGYSSGLSFMLYSVLIILSIVSSKNSTSSLISLKVLISMFALLITGLIRLFAWERVTLNMT